MIDLDPVYLEVIKKILYKYAKGCEARVFGSRINGTAKDYSDIDIALVSDNKIERKMLIDIKEAFQNSNLPFRVDILDWNRISDEFRINIEENYERLD
jgi:predicted nucleotidyltransferase